MTHSLKGRLLLASAVVLLGFVIFTGLALEKAFQNGARQAQEDRMKGLAYALLGNMEFTQETGLVMEETEFIDQRLVQPASGLGAAIFPQGGKVLWESPSFKEDEVQQLPLLEVGQWLLSQRKDSSGKSFFELSFGVSWASEKDSNFDFILIITEETAAFDRQLSQFRRTLWGWLLIAVAALLVTLVVVLRWGLLPLKKVTVEVHQVKEGSQSQIAGTYPIELQPLTEGLNVLLRHERGQTKRYRHTLDDLTHSLKTPLAVLRGMAEQKEIPADLSQRLKDQVARIDQMLGYQVRKAATVGRQAFTHPIRPRSLVDKLVTALSKVYQDKQVEYRVNLAAEVAIRVDEGDLMELLGNILDNASKYCRKVVTLEGFLAESHLVLTIDDDGPGFPVGQASQILQRGVRADSLNEGQGIGLAVVHEIVGLYGGTIELTTAPQGGARVTITLPTA